MQNSQELVSIVVPTFNQADFLAEALASVIAQTHTSWEAIVVNNFSTDHTVDVVNQIGDSRIALVNFANEGVIASSRNLGISKARGKYVAFLDSDDTWEPSKLTKSIGVLSSGADLVCHAERWFGGGSRERIVRYGPEPRASYDSLLLKGNCISTSAVVVRRSVLDQLNGFRTDPRFITTEDYDLWLRIAQDGFTISFITEVLGSFRRHQTSASSSTARHLLAELAVVNDHFASERNFGPTIVKHRHALAHYTAARSYSKSSKFVDALGSFLTSLRLNPGRPRTWAGLLVHLASPIRKRKKRA